MFDSLARERAIDHNLVTTACAPRFECVEGYSVKRLDQSKGAVSALRQQFVRKVAVEEYACVSKQTSEKWDTST